MPQRYIKKSFRKNFIIKKIKKGENSLCEKLFLLRFDWLIIRFSQRDKGLIELVNFMHKTTHNYSSTLYEKSSKKSRKNFPKGENLLSSRCEVTFTLLKLLRYPVKVGLLHGKSYSIMGQKFIYYTLILFCFSVKKPPLFNTH